MGRRSLCPGAVEWKAPERALAIRQGSDEAMAIRAHAERRVALESGADAVGDVPPGDYVLGVVINGKKELRRIRVETGRLTWVEFRPSMSR